MSGSKQNIYFHYTDQHFYFTNRNNLKAFLANLFTQEGFRLGVLNYIFCSDAYLLSYNQQYLNHNTLTDIITFGLNEEGEPIHGDIYISIDRVKENAVTYNVPFYLELHRVIIHGALHLCNYKDKSVEDKALMKQKEDYYLKQYFVSRETF